jgi:hypothetical protein
MLPHFRMLVATTEVAMHAARALDDDSYEDRYDRMDEQELRAHEIVLFVHILMLPLCYWLGKRMGRQHRNAILSGKEYMDGCCSARMLTYLTGLLAAGLFGFLVAYFGFKHGEASATREFRHAQGEEIPAEAFMTSDEAQMAYMPPQAVPDMSRPRPGEDDTVVAMPAEDDDEDQRVMGYMAESARSDGGGGGDVAAGQNKPLLQV